MEDREAAVRYLVAAVQNVITHPAPTPATYAWPVAEWRRADQGHRLACAFLRDALKGLERLS